DANPKNLNLDHPPPTHRLIYGRRRSPAPASSCSGPLEPRVRWPPLFRGAPAPNVTAFSTPSASRGSASPQPSIRMSSPAKPIATGFTQSMPHHKDPAARAYRTQLPSPSLDQTGDGKSGRVGQNRRSSD